MTRFLSTMPTVVRAGFLLGLVLVLALSSGSRAQTTEERLMPDPPAGWWIYENATLTEINSRISVSNARVIGLKVDDPTTPRFTAILVTNTGLWGKAWSWYYNQTSADLSAAIGTNARLITLQPYDVGGNLKFAVAMVSNTGADQKAWWYYYNQTAQNLMNLASANNARIIDFRSYLRGTTRYYSAVMISNSGADAHSWWMFAGATAATLSSFDQSNNVRPYSIAVNDPVAGTFDAIFIGCPCQTSWMDTGTDSFTLLNADTARNARIVAGESYDSGTGRVWAAVSLSLTPPSLFYPITPCRLLDTRNMLGSDAAWPALGPLEQRTFGSSYMTRCGIPGDAKSLMTNVTVVQPTAQGNLSLFPGGTVWPGTTSVSFRAGQVRANNAVAKLGANGDLTITNGSAGTANVVLDASGYFK